MFGSKILPAILIMVPTAVFVSVQASFSEPAAEECKTRPGTNAPRGAHWYYHVNRAKQHCWYLGVIDKHAAAAVTPAASTPVSTALRRKAAEPPPAQAAPAAPAAAIPAPAEAIPAPVAAAPAVLAPAAAAPALPEPPRGAGFVTRWPENLPNVEDVDQPQPAVVNNNNADGREAAGQAPPMPPQSLQTDADRALAGSGGEAALRYFSIAGAVAIPLLLAAGWAAKFARRPRRRDGRDQRQATATRLSPRRHLVGDELVGIAPLLVDRHGDADVRTPTPTDPAYDLKTSLAELMRDLRRAGAFEPVAEQSGQEPADHAEEEPADHLAWEPAEQAAGQPSQQASDEAASRQDASHEDLSQEDANEEDLSHEDLGTEEYYPVLEAAE